MNKFSKKIILTFFILLGIIMILNVKSYAGTQKWNSLDYNVQVNSDGSMNVIETWDIYVENTNTLFKNFDMDNSKFGRITDVRVAIIENNIETTLIRVYEEQYHVDKGCYYALDVGNSKFEIAWNVGLDNSKGDRLYKLYYKVNDVVKIYNDCTELYWMFLGRSNAISGKNITGKITLPNNVKNLDKLRVWAHGDLSGNIEKESTDTVTFKLPKISSGDMLEVRIVTEENIYPESNSQNYTTKLNSILDEEQEWADKSNSERELSRKIVFVLVLVNTLIGIFFVFIIIKYIKKGKEINEKFSYQECDLKYFRDIPDEKNSTPARAMFMHNFKQKNSRIDISKIFSATLLNLSLKGLVEFETIDLKNVRINLKKNNLENKNFGVEKKVELTEDEKIIYDILLDATKDKNTITTQEFSKYSEKKYEYVYTTLSKINKLAENFAKQNNLIDNKREVESQKYITSIILNSVFLILALLFYVVTIVLPVLYIGLITSLILSIKNYNSICILSEEGNKRRAEWKGLKQYLEDYSLIKEKTVPDIMLWEKFLVYATAFGISKKVIKQLKVVHPEMFYDNNSDYYRYNSLDRRGYWYLVCDTDFADNGIDILNSSISSVYNAASKAYSIAHSQSSSGSGGGGGFSHGGRRRRRRRRLRRPLIINILQKFYF